MSNEKLLELVDKITISQFPEEYEVFQFERDSLIVNLSTNPKSMLSGSNFNAELLEAVGTVLGYVATTTGTILLFKEAVENLKESKDNFEKLKDWLWDDDKDKEKKIKKRWKELLIMANMEPDKAQVLVETFYDDIAKHI